MPGMGPTLPRGSLKPMNSKRNTVLAVMFLIASQSGDCSAAESRFYHSDSNARYLHHIDLYDANNRKITADSTTPYSSVKTCGRCHDYEQISHGWHFNAFDPESLGGRSGEPWIWSDPRTGTQLPLNLRGWKNGFDPKAIGISQFEMASQFGARIPGGGIGMAPESVAEEKEPDSDSEPAAEPKKSARWGFSGSLEIDCMVCHAVSGAYDFNARREQITQENFAWAATAALRLGKVDGNASRIKDDADPEDESTKSKIPTVTYDKARFGADGTVFMNLVRQPQSNSCYQCHSSRTVEPDGIASRWNHDEDIHLRAGMVCADCHRNGIDHHITRGFDGEENPSEQSVATLSCAGCHLGADHAGADGEVHPDMLARAGRLGSPQPIHAGLPPLHFEKLTCTACHGGPAPRDQALRVMTSLSHGLGQKGHRTGNELPLIASPVYAKTESGAVAPHRAMWPAFWAKIVDGKAIPISPPKVYDLTRRGLRVRKSFAEDIFDPKVSSKTLKEILGEDRYKIPTEQQTDDERKKIRDIKAADGLKAFNEKVFKALESLEKELGVEQAAYVSAGHVYARGDEPNTLEKIKLSDPSAIEMVRWPTAHNVRPAGWALGAGGCVECHSEEGKMFTSTVTAIGPGPDQGGPVAMATLQGIDPDQRLAWNELFKGRKSFKYIVGGAIVIMSMVLMIGVGAFASRFVANKQVA